MTIFGMVTTTASQEYTPHALKSFFDHTFLHPTDRFFLIDNDGADNNSTNDYSSAIEVIRNDTPRGFAANVNQLIEKALESGEDLYFLNNDVIFTPNWLRPLQDHPRSILTPLSNREAPYTTAVVASKTQKTMKMFQIEMVMSLEDYLPNEKLLQGIAETHQQTCQGYWRVYLMPFFCVKLPIAIMKAIGYFDESFGNGGGEDYDYALRAYLAGFNAQYALQSYLLHFGGKSTYSGAESKEEQLAREKQFFTIFEKKWGSHLHDLILKEKSEIIQQSPELVALDQSGNLAEVIRCLMGERQVETFLPKGNHA